MLSLVQFTACIGMVWHFCDEEGEQKLLGERGRGGGGGEVNFWLRCTAGFRNPYPVSNTLAVDV